MRISLIILLAVVLLILYSGCLEKETFAGFPDNAPIINPTYLQTTAKPEDTQYEQAVIQRQDNEIRRLRRQVKKLAEVIDDGAADSPTEKFYRRKLSNSYYRVAPYLTSADDNYLNVHDDDFSTKTLSTIKFLSQTRPSKFHGKEVHFPTELCDNFCETEDRNATFHEQIDLVRPVSPTSYVREKAK